MRLFGVEQETDIRDLFTFQCDNCGRLEVRGAVARQPTVRAQCTAPHYVKNYRQHYFLWAQGR